MTAAISREERLDWLQLIRTESIGPISFFRLLKKFGSAAAALDALPRLARAAGRAQPPALADRETCARELDLADELGVRIILACEPDYPRLLRPLPDRPPVLYAKGHPSLFERPAVAIIGARNASGAGRKIARDLAQGLGAEGVVVVSGLARGIDGTAHAAAIETGTIAVVAGGVDVIYPPEHEDLTLEIAARGLLVCERALGHQPTARDFPRRNRLISGLARGVVVVEAAAKSGTLITARFALDQGREVFAVPGSPLDPRCQGANRLIRDGATLVETAEDILEVLAAQARGARETGPDDLFDWAEGAGETDEAPDAAPPELRAAVFELLSFTPLHRDEILRAAGAPPGLVADALLELVLAGEAEELPGGAFVRAAR
ncbi:DNA-processing protein DprA [Amphiplicatus metriothermophilus]|uniref:DNA processing protein n=1 Tax=Amphiplicatus metriothermophilus TaxID=1519374 RepID=A0A239PV73_9PROT|nr:DNA-processing protein DprA [Amphiplicatus metriothermophilus]MBB5519421.1 DNA processing protein [Amphiplicatus metriothermophilus]SNT73587.1 DNA processing protein [Amphiplicatus metriothermophilus]